MVLYDIDVNSVVPYTGTSVTPSYNHFSFQTNGDGTYNYAVEEIFSLGNVDGTTVSNFIYWGEENRLSDQQTVDIIATLTNASSYIGAKLGIRIYNFGYIFTANTSLNYLWVPTSSANLEYLSSIQTGDKIWLYVDELSGIHYEYYVHVFGTGFFLTGMGKGYSPYFRCYTTIDAARAGYLSNAVSFVSGTVYNMRKVVYTPIITLNLIASRPTIQMDTVYSDQTLSYDNMTNIYTCSNANINLHFTLTGTYTEIYRYRILLFDREYGTALLEPTSIGDWVYSKDMYYDLSSQRSGTNVYLRLEAYDTLNALYTTQYGQYSQEEYQVALAISFDYSGKYPSLPMIPTAEEECHNGYDLISWQSALLLYGGTYPLASDNTYTGYTSVTNFVTRGNSALNLQTDYTLRYARNDTYHTPSYLVVEDYSSAPTFWWQPSEDGFEGTVMTFGDTNGNMVTISLSNGRIYRTYTSSTGSTYTIDDGALIPLKATVYLVGVTDERTIFKSYFTSNYVHNTLNFDLSDGSNVL